MQKNARGHMALDKGERSAAFSSVPRFRATIRLTITIMHKRSLSLSTISGTESEACDEPVTRKRAHLTESSEASDEPVARMRYRQLEALIDEDDVVLFVKPSKCALTSNEHEQLSTRNQAALQHVVNSLAKLKPQNVHHQPPHPQHTPSPLEIAQTNALISDQKVKMVELNAKLGEMTRDMLLLTRQRDAAVQAARNYRSFIAGKCLS
jgi:hypothetical protein